MRKDLVLLVPDKNTEGALKGALERHRALGIREITFDFRTHEGRDGGVRTNGVETVCAERHRFEHALMVFDFEGCGENQGRTREGLEADLSKKLKAMWGIKSEVVVINPEVDIWMWGSNDSLARVLRWQESDTIRTWLGTKNFTFGDAQKPHRPKEAIESIFRHLKIPRSSAIYQDIAGKISLQNCIDTAFVRMRNQLQQWFPNNLSGKE
ncbi:MAG: hypothetical protein WCD07_03295 [Burkholderiales bacterium]